MGGAAVRLRPGRADTGRGECGAAESGRGRRVPGRAAGRRAGSGGAGGRGVVIGVGLPGGRRGAGGPVLAGGAPGARPTGWRWPSAGPDLPVPEVREVGRTPSGWVYAVSVRHHGRFVEDAPAGQAGAMAPALTRLLVALYRAGRPGYPGDVAPGGRGRRELAVLSAAPPGGCGPWRRAARGAGTWYTAICCTAMCW